MADTNDHQSFDRLNTSVGQFDISGRTLLVPDMAPIATRLLAASFRAMGVDAVVMETYAGLTLGKEFTSGKECFPCQVTLGDILHHLRKEKERLGPSFSPDRYAYFLPEADGPCRFGMYNKMQRLVLDRFDEFRDVPIVYVTTGDAYATGGIIPPERSTAFRKLAFLVVIIADVMDRITWRVRPYELRPGITDAFMKDALKAMIALIEKEGTDLNFPRLFNAVEDIAEAAGSFIDTRIPRKPRLGIVGEIYLRSHPDSNQHIVRLLEHYGGEVLDASMGEWVRFVTFEQRRKLARRWKMAWLDADHGRIRSLTRQWLGSAVDEIYQYARQRQVYRRALKHLDISADHSIQTIERRLQRNTLFTFEIGTEAALSIGGALEYAREGFNGIVNVFPFTCMPSTICAAILKPLLHKMKIPYLDAPYDGAIQPNREVAVRTFVYQAQQHLESRTTRRNRQG